MDSLFVVGYFGDKLINIYAIHLRRATFRHSHIERYIKRCIPELEIVEAIDGTALSSQELEHFELFQRAAAFTMTPSMFACALSHRLAYLRLLADCAPCALILEDDAVLSAGVPDFCRAVEKGAHPGQICFLSYYNHDKSAVRLESNPAYLIGGYPLHRPLDPEKLASGLAYVMTRDAARSMLDQMPRAIGRSDDWGLFLRNGLRAELLCLPRPIVSPLPCASTIDYKGKAKSWFDSCRRAVRSSFIVERVVARLHKRRPARQTEVEFVDVVQGRDPSRISSD